MADGTSDTSVTVMSAEQVTQLITAITTSIGDLKTALVSELSTIKTNLATTNTKLDNLKTQMSSGTTVDFSSVTTALNSIKNQINTSVDAVNIKLEGIQSQINSNVTSLTTSLTGVGTKVETVATKVEAVADELKVDITPSNLNLEYGSKTGVKSIAFVEASKHVLTLKRIKEAREDDESSSDDGGDSGSSSQDPAESEEAAAVNEEVRQNATEVFDELVGYEFSVTEDERITFKTKADFESSRTGLSFDYTRMYYENALDIVENTKVNEYALLVFESLVKTSEKSGENDVKRMKSWVDRKVVQTVVITTNTISSACIVYFPTQESYDALDTETYKSEKDAMDAIVKKYQEIMEDTYKGIAFVPVESIERGITLEEYRTKAKNITPTCEYT